MLLLVAALASLGTGAKGAPRIAVLDVKGRAGVDAALAQAVSDAVVSEVRRLAKDYAVISTEEIRNLLALEKQRQQLGCENVSCLAEIGGALGAQQMVTGSLSLFGDLYVLSLKRVEVSKSSVREEASGRIQKGGERDLPDLVAKLCRSLFPEFAPPAEQAVQPDVFATSEAPPAAPAPSSHVLSWVLVGTSVVTAGVAIGTGVAVSGYANEFNRINNLGNPDSVKPAQASTDGSTAQALEGVAIGCGVAALLAAVGAVIAW